MSKRRFALWLLAVLMSAQAVGASVLATLGPAHAHRAGADSVGLEYFDLRRAPTPIASRPTHVLAAFGHFHSDAQPRRHHHRGDDGTVVLVDAGASPQGDEAREATAAAALGVIALLPSPLAAFTTAERSGLAAGLCWPSLTHDPEPLERPPRVA